MSAASPVSMARGQQQSRNQYDFPSPRRLGDFFVSGVLPVGSGENVELFVEKQKKKKKKKKKKY